MRDQLLPEERVLVIQEALCGFNNEQVLNKKRKFYYDQVSNIDNSCKYDNIVKLSLHFLCN